MSSQVNSEERFTIAKESKYEDNALVSTRYQTQKTRGLYHHEQTQCRPRPRVLVSILERDLLEDPQRHSRRCIRFQRIQIRTSKCLLERNTKMKPYEVKFQTTATVSVFVDASDSDQALEYAWDLIYTEDAIFGDWECVEVGKE